MGFSHVNIIDDTMAVYDESNANYRFAHTIYNICKSSATNDEKNRQLARIYRQMGIEGADAEKRMCADVSTVSTTKNSFLFGNNAFLKVTSSVANSISLAITSFSTS